MVKRIILLIMVITLGIRPMDAYANTNRVIFEFEQISDQSGTVTLRWMSPNQTAPIQITGYRVINPHKVEVSYRIGNVTNNNSMLIKHADIKFPLKIVLKHSEQVILTDLPEDVEEKEHIQHLYDRGVISGYPDGTFRSSNSVTREEFATMIVNAAGYEKETKKASPFTDVKETDWSKDNIVTLASKGILAGRGNGKFDPRGDITIGEVIAVLDRTFSVHTGQQAVFEQPSKGHWSNSNYQSLIKQGIIRKEDHFSFPYQPDKKATRLDCAILISRVLEQVYQSK